jgi:hypothetical protein
MMKNKSDISQSLREAFKAIEDFLTEIKPENLHKKSGEAWSIAEEMGHLLSSTFGTGFLFAQSLDKFRIAQQTSRSYEELVNAYQEALQKNPITNNPNTFSSEQVQQSTIESLTKQWKKASGDCLNNLATWQEEDLDKYTVWKHPLLGVFTAREMALFTVYHTLHHSRTLSQKNT